MNFRQLGSNDLSDFAANVKQALTSGDLPSIGPDQRAELLAAIALLPEELAVLAEESEAMEAARKAKVSERNAKRSLVRVVMSRVGSTLKAAGGTRAEYARCGFRKPVRRSKYIARDPDTVSAARMAGGAIRLKFRGNNRPAQISYHIWRKSDDGPWELAATIKRQSFVDTDVMPAGYYEYKVRAWATRTVSNFSESAVVR